MEGFVKILHGPLPPLLLLLGLLLPLFIPLSTASTAAGALSRETKELSRGADDEDQALRTTRVSRVTSRETSHSVSTTTGLLNHDSLARRFSLSRRWRRQTNDTKSLLGTGHLRHQRRRTKRKRRNRTKKTNDDYENVFSSSSSSSWRSFRKDQQKPSEGPSGLSTKRSERPKDMKLKISSKTHQQRDASKPQRNHERAALLPSMTKQIFSEKSLRKTSANSLKPNRSLVDLLIDKKSSDPKGKSSSPSSKKEDMRSASDSGENKERPTRTNARSFLTALSRRMMRTSRKKQFVIPIMSGRSFSKLQFNPNIEVSIEVLRHDDDDLTPSTSVDGAQVAATADAQDIHPTLPPPPPPRSTPSPYFDYYYYEDYHVDADWLASIYSNEDSRVLAPSGSVDFDSSLDFNLDTTFVGPDFVIPEKKHVATSAPALTGGDQTRPTSDSFFAHDRYESGGTFLVNTRHNLLNGVTRPYNLWDDVAREGYDCEEERQESNNPDNLNKGAWKEVENIIDYGGSHSSEDYDTELTSLVQVSTGGESEGEKQNSQKESQNNQDRDFKGTMVGKGGETGEESLPVINIISSRDLASNNDSKSAWDVSSSDTDKQTLADRMNSSTVVDLETGNSTDPVSMPPRDLIRKLAMVLDRLQEEEEEEEERNQVLQDGDADACAVWTTCRAETVLQQLSFLSLLPSCPCLYPADIVYVDTIWDPNHNRTFRWRAVNSNRERIDIFRAGAHKCIRSQVQAITVSLAIQTCCYDRHQQLITRGSGAGTPSLVSPELSPRLHHRVDVLPWLACNGNFVRYNAVRPPNNDQQCPTHPDDKIYNMQLLLATDY